MKNEGLYDRGYIVEFSPSEVAVHRHQINYVSSVYDTFHTIGENEDLYFIARKYYGSSSLWYLIADVNSSIIVDIFNLPINETIVIPNLNVIKSSYVRF